MYDDYFEGEETGERVSEGSGGVEPERGLGMSQWLVASVLVTIGVAVLVGLMLL